MTRPDQHRLPVPADRPADSDGLPSGDWAHEIGQAGYRLHGTRAPSAVVPTALIAMVLAATLLMCALWWDRIPAQVAAHTGADGEVTRWEPRSVGTVLIGPLLGCGTILASSVMILLSSTVQRPRPGDPFVDGLGPMIRLAAQGRRFAAAVIWSLLPWAVALCLMSALGWADGSGRMRAGWMLGAAMLLMPVIAGLLLRGLRGDVEHELSMLRVPLGPASREDLHRWRLAGLVDDPGLPLLVQSMPSNWTLNVAHRTGRLLCWAFAGVWLLVGMLILLGPLLL